MVITWIKPKNNQRSVYCAREGMVLLRDGNEWDILSFRYQKPAKMLPDKAAHKRKLNGSLLRG